MATNVVITGGPGSGKTTVVEALQALGYSTVPEAAIQVIDELNEELGVEEQKRWRRQNTLLFQERIFERQVELESEPFEIEPKAGLLFLDRGRLDGLAYLRHFRGEEGKREGEKLLWRTSAPPYGLVFLLETLSLFEDRSSTGRTSRREDSLAIARAIDEVYQENGYQPVFIPEIPVPDRIELILQALKSL